jgi:hypothetical protein
MFKRQANILKTSDSLIGVLRDFTLVTLAVIRYLERPPDLKMFAFVRVLSNEVVKKVY